MGGCTDYVKVPIFLDFVDNFPHFSPISLTILVKCKIKDLAFLNLDNVLSEFYQALIINCHCKPSKSS